MNKHVKRCEDGREKMLFLRAEVRMLGCSAFEAILQLARRNDGKADDALAVRGKLLADRGRMGSQQIDPHRGVQQVHGAQSVVLAKSLSRSARGAWCWRRSSTKSRGNFEGWDRPAQRWSVLGLSTIELLETLHIDATTSDAVLLRKPHGLAASSHKHLCFLRQRAEFPSSPVECGVFWST